MVAPAGSRRRDELQADLDEARLSLVWLKVQHWGWYVALGGETRICGSLLDGAIEHGLMLQGSRYLYTARMVVQRYERWGNTRDSAGGAARCDMLIGGSVYPPTPALISWFISDEIADYRDLVAVRAAKGGSGKFKGTTGLGLVKSLGYAHQAYAAPFPPELLQHPLVKLAAVPPPDCEEEEEEEAHMPLFLALAHAELARFGSTGTDCEGNAHPICDVARDWARAFAFLEVNGLRGVEGLRSRFASFNLDAGHAVFKCAGGKPRKLVKLTPFSDFAPDEGFDGIWPWFFPWVSQLVGHPFVLRAFKVPKGGNFLYDARWDGCHAATPAMLAVAWGALGAAPPFGASAAQMRAGRCTPYAPRHVLQDVVRDQGWVQEDRNELNRWAKLPRKVDNAVDAAGAEPRAAASGTARRPVNRYSSGRSAQDRRLDLRLEALRVVQRYLEVDGRSWREALPRERGVLPTFSFLRRAPEASRAGMLVSGGDDGGCDVD